MSKRLSIDNVLLVVILLAVISAVVVVCIAINSHTPKSLVHKITYETPSGWVTVDGITDCITSTNRIWFLRPSDGTGITINGNYILETIIKENKQ